MGAHVRSVKLEAVTKALKLARVHYITHVLPLIKAEQLKHRQQALRIGLQEAKSLMRANAKGARCV